MIGLKREKKEELIGIGYNAGDLIVKSKKVLEKKDPDEMLERILKNQIFILKILNGQLVSLE